MKVERDKKREKRKTDDANIASKYVAKNIVRWILKPTSHNSSSLDSRPTSHLLTDSYEGNNETDRNRLEVPTTIESQDKGFENSHSKKRRVGFQTDITVKVISIDKDESDGSIYDEDIRDTDSGDLDEFFQSIDDITSSCADNEETSTL